MLDKPKSETKAEADARTAADAAKAKPDAKTDPDTTAAAAASQTAAARADVKAARIDAAAKKPGADVRLKRRALRNPEDNDALRAEIKAKAKKEGNCALYVGEQPFYRLGVYTPAGEIIRLPLDEDPSITWTPYTGKRGELSSEGDDGVLLADINAKRRQKGEEPLTMAAMVARRDAGEEPFTPEEAKKRRAEGEPGTMSEINKRRPSDQPVGG